MTALIMTRAEARAQGLTRYFTAEPCKRGHIVQRLTSTGQCSECLSITKKLWRAVHREHYNAKTRAAKAANPDRVRLNAQKWQSTPHGRSVKARLQRDRRARLRGSAGKHTAGDVSMILELQGGKCAYCRDDVRSGYEIDHIVSLAKGGANDRRNIQITCGPCNRRKRTKDPIVFARERGLLI